MARELTAIYDALAEEKATHPELTDLAPNMDSSQQLLADLESPSQVARWRIMLWVVAVGIWSLEKLWDVFHAEVEQLAAASHVGTPRWYVEKALQYQYGYALVDIDGVFQYATDDPAARIVARAAVVEAGGVVTLKVAKLSGTMLVPLSSPELAAFDEYVDQVKMAGVVVNLLSADPDYLKLQVDVYYDPLVIAADGSLILNGSIKPVEDAINEYIASLPFNGALTLTNLVDAMQAAEGVVNPVLQSAEARYAGFPLTTIAVSYGSYAGHMAIDPLYPLPTTINYIPAGV